MAVVPFIASIPMLIGNCNSFKAQCPSSCTPRKNRSQMSISRDLVRHRRERRNLPSLAVPDEARKLFAFGPMAGSREHRVKARRR